MKFGKSIVASQVPGWADYYLNYKALKKIINSLAAGRPASEAALLSRGGRPSKRRLSDALPSDTSAPFSPAPSDTATPVFAPAAEPPSTDVGDLEPLPPEAEAPAPGGSRNLLSGGAGANGAADRGESFKAHRDVFFFTLQRELEKINAFYLIKERDLRLRLLTLLSNRKRLLRTQRELVADGHDIGEEGGKRSAEWASLEEGWRLFERDLGKLQGFIEINATGFRKILKKWDKRSKSNTKELYIERQVEVQPCFNREFIAKLSDIVAANLLDIENGSDHLTASFFAAELPEAVGDDGLAFDRSDNESDPGEVLASDALFDLEVNLPKTIEAGRDAFARWVKHTRKVLNKDKRGEGRAMRVLWRAALTAPDDYLDLLFNPNLDFNFVDKINDRTPLHQAAIAGSLRLVELCIANSPELIERQDAYARRPLHYASMHGHPSIVSLLLSSHADPSATDQDGYTPLMHAITQGHLEVVRIFVQSGEPVNLEPTAISTDLIPLSLACQYGHVEVARLLLERGAKVRPNSEGLFPMHFAAKAGHEAICRLLVEAGGPDGGGKDKQDKYNMWTPIHHAAVGGRQEHLDCIKVLVAAGCDVNVVDEYGKAPGWYAAWFGHVKLLNFLIASGAKLATKETEIRGMENLGLAADPQMDALSPGSDIELDPPLGDDFELIPSLSLPPPIIPLRVYGHEFLAKRCLVQLSLGHPFKRGHEKTPPVKLYSRSSQDNLHLWSSLKLVMTSKSDTSVVPHSVILPLADEREVFSFQVQSLDKFTLEVSLYPTFGSKVIGRAVILPSTFLGIQDHKGIVAPLLDHHLKTIGEVAFEVSCIRPFEGAQLEIGGRVETYWKSKVTPSNATQDHAHQFQSHRPIGVTAQSPAVRPSAVVVPSQVEPAHVTASSLSGDYVRLIVQVTKDGVPVVYPDFKLPVPGLDIGVSDVTFAQFDAMAKDRGLTLPTSATATTAQEWRTVLAKSMTSVERILALVPADVGINLCLLYTRKFDAHAVGVGSSLEVNGFVDAVLQVVYDAGKLSPGRKILFSSFDPTVCTALNWKQPNYAVFFASFCGIDRNQTAEGAKLVSGPPDTEPDTRCLSVREAVNFAKVTNLLGVILEATTLAAVPSLVASVKDAGLLLAGFGQESDLTKLRQGASDGRTVDAFCSDGIMTLVI
ncbi:Ankyrin repeat protein nuc-2 [Vanrija pseudolonga]|uniref:Ankyrin repeat protein nuc-2 n=1 Tax=Vanrija pseudolonga TaxID=143232 RepID=A0AAF1BH69_9TREE|nr:Ankyrin repeat protein nuc-2 [Vanrija pseudolonga]